MKPLIREKRKLTFDYKRITPEIIRQFAFIVDGEANQTPQGQLFIVYSVDAMDNSSYESQSVIIFDPNEIVDKKPIQKINMRFNTTDYSKSIELQILQAHNNSSENFISVSGNDTTWVNGIMGRFSEVLALCEKQPTYANWSGWVMVGAWVLSIALYIQIFSAKFKNTAYADPIFLAVLIGFTVIFIRLNTYVTSMWPSVELQTGFGYLQIPQKKRNRMNWIIGILVVPVLLEIFYDFAKSLLHIF